MALESKLLNVSNEYMFLLLKSSGSSIIIGSDVQAVRVRADGSRAPVFINVDDTIGASCLTGGVICDCLGNGLSIGGVGGAVCRGKASTYGIDLVVGVP